MKTLSYLRCVSVCVALAVGTTAAAEEETEEKRGIGDRIGSGVSTLNKVGGGLLNKVGGVASKVANLKDAKAPGSVAVLPATGEGEENERAEIRIAVHNSLGSTNIRSVKPAEVDRLLVVAETRTGQKWQDIPRKDLSQMLSVDGLLYVDVEELERLYAGAYAHYEVGVGVKLYTVEKDDFIWQQSEKEAQRKGGVSLNPLGMIATAVSSARILTDAVRQVLINTLARKLAEDIPQPSSMLSSKKPIIIDMAVSNGVEGPFSVGDEIKVVAQAEPGLVIFYDIQGLATQLPLEEKQAGEYIGSYVVADGENAKNLFVSLRATRVSDKQSLVWRVPGKIEVDTIPPGDVREFQARSTSDGVALNWQAPFGEDLASLEYQLERANVTDGVYQDLGMVAINEFTDAEVNIGESYYYRIRSTDKAGNEGAAISQKVAVFKPGPTVLSGLLEGDITFPAIGNPYSIEGDLTIVANANIAFDEGVILELSQDQKINVQGLLRFTGSETGQLSVRGDGWTIVYDGSGSSNSTADYVRFSGFNSKIELRGSSLALNHVVTDGTTIELGSQAAMTSNQSEFYNAEPAVRVMSGSAVFKDSQFISNVQAVLNLDAAGQQAVSFDNVTFNRNQQAFLSEVPYTMQGVDFGDLTLSDIQAQLEGPVSLDWSNLEGGGALIRDWLEPNMADLQAALQKEQWLDARDVAQNIINLMPSDGMKALHETLDHANTGFSNVSYNQSAVSGLMAEGNRFIWIQSETLPALQAKSSELSSRAVLKKFGKHYVKEQFPNKRSVEVSKLTRTVKFEDAVEDSVYLYSVEKGLLSEVWVAHVVNRSVMGSLLAGAGLGSSSGSQNLFAVAIDNSVASNIMLDILESQKVRYKMGKGSEATPYRIAANVVMTDSSSQISQNLNVAEATVRLRIEEVATNRVVATWKAAGSASAFSQSDAHQKALSGAFKKVESLLVRRLWQLDSRPIAKKPAVVTPVATEAATPSI